MIRAFQSEERLSSSLMGHTTPILTFLIETTVKMFGFAITYLL